LALAASVGILSACSSNKAPAGPTTTPVTAGPSTTSKTQATAANTIDTPAYRIRVPAGVTNEATTRPERGSIVVNYRRPYGLVKLEVFPSTLDLSATKTKRNCKTVETDVKVDGAKATRYDGDCANVVSGPSSKDLIRYTIDFDKIPKPSEAKYTVVSITLLKTQDVPPAGIAMFKADAQQALDSLVIK